MLQSDQIFCIWAQECSLHLKSLINKSTLKKSRVSDIKNFKEFLKVIKGANDSSGGRFRVADSEYGQKGTIQSTKIKTPLKPTNESII